MSPRTPEQLASAFLSWVNGGGRDDAEWFITRGEALAVLEIRDRDLNAALDAAGLPRDTPIAGLIEHHRNNAAQAAAAAVFS